MTAATNTERYVDRIGRVRDYIHAHLDEPLNLDTLAEIACLSRFHWHRVYRAMTGETAAQTVRRLRLARAAHDLANSREEIAVIAARAGYAAPAAFNRAFASSYGMPPATFRTSGQHAALYRAQQEENPMAFPVDLRALPTRPALALEHRGAYGQISRSFDALGLSLRSANVMPHVQGMFGRYIDDPDAVAESDLRSHACVFVDDAAVAVPGLVALPVASGRYAVLRYRGPYAAMKPAYDWLFGTWLPSSGRVARDEAILEIYLKTPMDTDPAGLLTEICLPVQD